MRPRGCGGHRLECCPIRFISGGWPWRWSGHHRGGGRRGGRVLIGGGRGRREGPACGTELWPRRPPAGRAPALERLGRRPGGGWRPGASSRGRGEGGRPAGGHREEPRTAAPRCRAGIGPSPGSPEVRARRSGTCRPGPGNESRHPRGDRGRPNRRMPVEAAEGGAEGRRAGEPRRTECVASTPRTVQSPARTERPTGGAAAAVRWRARRSSPASESSGRRAPRGVFWQAASLRAPLGQHGRRERSLHTHCLSVTLTSDLPTPGG
jgi:hypothetical protein